MKCMSSCTVLLIVTGCISVFLADLLVRTDDLTANDSDIELTTVELIAKYGYPAVSHTIVTDDGYILTLHRIPYGKKSSQRRNRPPVLVQHGLICSSEDWIIMGPDKGLGYILADAGYDVWLGNSRGNVWSKKHVTLHPSSAKFWNFSWHEMGVYDLPSVVDYILEETGQEQLFYVGFSMGSTIFYVMASEKPSYNGKIRLMISLAPSIYGSHCTAWWLKGLSAVGKEIGFLLNLLGIHQILPPPWLTTLVGRLFCSDGAITQSICFSIYFSIGGYNMKELNTTALPLIMGHTPRAAVVKTFLHYGQNVNTGEFQQYDYGNEKNLLEYGSHTPPKYNISMVTAPVAIFYGQNDVIADPKDAAKTKTTLPNVVAYQKVEDEEFGHIDFLYSVHVKSLVYDDVLNLMSKY